MNASPVRALTCARVRLVRVEAGDVAVVDVDLGVAVGHPLGDRATDARTLLDPHRGRRPEALDLALAEDRRAVGGQREQAVDRVADLGALGAEQLGHQLEGLLELRVEVVLGERHLGRRQLRPGRARGCPRGRAGSPGARRSRPPCRRRAGARSRTCPCRARSGRRSRPPARRAAGTGRPRSSGARRGSAGSDAGHVADLRAPDAAGDDDVLGLDVAAGRCAPGGSRPCSVLDVEAGHLDVRARR